MHPKPIKVVSEALRQSARGRPCSIRLPGVCNHDPSTTVLAHLPSGASGVGTKSHDMHAAFACSACHDVIDGRRKTMMGGAIILDAILRGLAETQEAWVREGLLTVEGWAP